MLVMSHLKGRRRVLRWAWRVLLGVPALLFIASLVGAFPWSPINCTNHEVDIQSGRTRFTRYLFWIPIYQSVDDSALTRALRPEDVAANTPRWRCAVTLSPGLGHSPHYVYHSAINQIRVLEVLWSAGAFTPAARRASAKRVIQLWRDSESDEGAERYLLAIDNLLFAAGTARTTTDEADLPSL